MVSERRRRIYLTCQILGWSAHGLINLGFATLAGQSGWPIVASIALLDGAAGYSTHLLRAWMHRHRWLSLPMARVAPRVLVGSLVCGAGVTLAGTITSLFVFHFNRNPDWNWINIVPIFFLWSVVVFLWAVIYVGVHYLEGLNDARLEQLRLAVAVKDSELRALLNQLNPHFMFNCLNSLRALIVEDPGRAQTMVDELSSVLRYSLRSARLETVPFEDELGAIQAYLKLEAIRFEDRLRVSMDIDPASLGSAIPPMLVQSLVENGVKHGVSRLEAGGEIRLVSRVEERALRIQVVNSGQLVAAGVGTRIGIENARERLRLMYGEAATLALRNLDGAFVIAEVSVPLRGADA